MTKLRLARGVEFDIDNIPTQFNKIVAQCFEKFTEGTAEKYRYMDKLRFIDIMTERTHCSHDEEDVVYNLMERHFEYEVKNNGNIPDKSDYLDVNFMVDCYVQGRQDMSLYSHFGIEKHDDEKLMKLFCRVIKIVMEWGE